MTKHVPFAVRILAEVWRLVAWPTRNFVAAIYADAPAAFALGVLLIVVSLSLGPALRTLIVAERWIARHVAESYARQARDRERRELDALAARIEPLYDCADDPPAQHLPGVVRLGHTAPPHKTRRRRMPGVRIPRRVVRHTFDSDRRS